MNADDVIRRSEVMYVVRKIPTLLTPMTKYDFVASKMNMFTLTI